MGMVAPSSIIEKIKRGEPLDEDDIRYVRMIREYTARHALPLPALLAVTAAIVGALVVMTVALVSGS